MCRVAGVARINDENRQKAWEFMKLLGEAMTVGNNDGLGYAAFDKSGNLFGEKWLVNRTAFTDVSQIKGMHPNRVKSAYDSFGEIKRDEAQAMILHTRFATCEMGIKNTHPFVNDLDNPTSVIIHNGVIANHMTLTKKYSSCDSEVIVHLYDQLKVSENLENLQPVMDELIGWFTVLGLSKDSTGRMILDGFTDSPRLNSYFIPELQTRVFSTAAADIKKTAKELGMTCIDHKMIKADSGFRLDAVTGELIQEFVYKVAPTTPSFNMHEAQPDDLREWLQRHTRHH